MTIARPEKCKCHIPPKYQCPRHGCCNETITAYDAYTDELLNPLEEIVKKYSDEKYVGISATIILNHIHDVLAKHEAGTGEGEA